MTQLLLDLFGTPVPARAVPPPPALAPLPVPAQAPIALPDALAPAQFAHPRANRSLRLGAAEVAYELRRSRRKTIGFVVTVDGLTVSAPNWTPVAEVEAVLRQRAGWLVDKLGVARERQARLHAARIDWKEGASVPFLGQPAVLRLDPRQRHGGGAVLEAQTEGGSPEAPGPTLVIGLPHTATPEQLRDAAQAWLMRQARRNFTQRLDHFAPRLGVQWRKLSLSSAGTRWGSASADGSIRLNWRLIHFGQPIIDYVVVHELAHLREMNHGARFWRHVQDVLPDYAERRGALQGEVLPDW